MNTSPNSPLPELGRIDVHQAAQILGFPDSDIPVLFRARLPSPLGTPGPTSPRWLSAVEVRELAASRDWLDKAQRAVSKHHWQRNKERRGARSVRPSAESKHGFAKGTSDLPRTRNFINGMLSGLLTIFASLWIRRLPQQKSGHWWQLAVEPWPPSWLATEPCESTVSSAHRAFWPSAPLFSPSSGCWRWGQRSLSPSLSLVLYVCCCRACPSSLDDQTCLRLVGADSQHSPTWGYLFQLSHPPQKSCLSHRRRTACLAIESFRSKSSTRAKVQGEAEIKTETDDQEDPEHLWQR
jgi:hypothetical protein